jgi:aspartate beta-hydroxylase
MTNDRNSATAYREMARVAMQRGDLALAEQSFARLLETEPADGEALQFLASRHLARGETARSIDLLTLALHVQPEAPTILHLLGTAQLMQGALHAAVDSLRRALAIAPGLFVARLRLGIALEQLGQAHDALMTYFTAINAAQSQGRWLGDATTAPIVREAVKHAMKYVNTGRRQLLDAVLEPLRQRYGATELGRVERCLAIYLGEQLAEIPDARQRPKFLYFPNVPSQPFYPRDRFEWQEELESKVDIVLQELRAVLSTEQRLESFLGNTSAHELKNHLRSSRDHRQAAWDAYFFYRHGQRHDDECACCPKTTALIDSLPLVRIRDHAPETLFSVLRPGTHILPHRGVTNTRLVTHLPLIVPPDCALRVGGETHVWKQGRCVTFDDTFEHEAWNDSDQTRVVLILDCWNPDLSETERAAVTDLVEAIGDFNRSCEVAAPGS